MAKQNLKDQENEQEKKVVETVSRTEEFFDKNKSAVYIFIIALLVIGVAVLCYHKFYYQPKKAEAMEQMFPAENNFRSQEYKLALNGDGNVLGFEQIIKEYGAKGGKSVYFYAGICELKLGNYQEAVSYLKKYTGKDPILAARATACIGDAYVGLKKYGEALTYFEKAASKADNIFAATYLLKAGVVCEEMGKTDKALSFYKEIKDKYPQSVEGYDIDKYISRIESSTASK
ncbi:MAG: tetratricopeptide repeat protein [Bacteroidales bacterium]|jgi:tetratricopeptide (TPR) repeat protein|nr:tetratricopeptide repeat protein [Bacteroidales bacterium]MCI1785759.1 tetratricopeptide repeat protein [Bacteroidales bacterium]